MISKFLSLEWKQFSRASYFQKGIATASLDSENWGYIDKKGLFKINPMFSEAHNYVGEYALVRQGKAYGFINRNGDFIINPQFKEVILYANSTILNGIATTIPTMKRAN